MLWVKFKMDIETKNQVFLQKYARKKILVMGKNYELALPFSNEAIVWLIGCLNLKYITKMKIATYNNMWYLNVKQKPICQNEKWRTEYRMIHSICFQRTFVCRESRQQDRLELLLPCVSFRMLSSLDQCYNATWYVGTFV